MRCGFAAGAEHAGHRAVFVANRVTPQREVRGAARAAALQVQHDVVHLHTVACKSALDGLPDVVLAPRPNVTQRPAECCRMPVTKNCDAGVVVDHRPPGAPRNEHGLDSAKNQAGHLPQFGRPGLRRARLRPSRAVPRTQKGSAVTGVIEEGGNGWGRHGLSGAEMPTGCRHRYPAMRGVQQLLSAMPSPHCRNQGEPVFYQKRRCRDPPFQADTRAGSRLSGFVLHLGGDHRIEGGYIGPQIFGQIEHLDRIGVR